MRIECPRCSGTGELPHFKHVDGGVCFLCDGEKTIEASEIKLPESACVCYQDNRNCTEHHGQPFPKEWRIERFSLVVNGGRFMPNGWDYVTAVTDENRASLRALWMAAKASGVECKAYR